MFKKPIGTPQKSKLKSSAQRTIRARVLSQFPLLEPVIDDILPKKSQLDHIKLPEKLSLYSLNGKVLFWQHFDDALIPHLRVVHAYPQCFPAVMVDHGAIRFVLAGAQLMCPGLTSPGAWLPGEGKPRPAAGAGNDGTDEQIAMGIARRECDPGEPLEEGTVVQVLAEGKVNACMVGVLKMSTKQIREINKDVAVENGHYLDDALWKFKEN